MFRTVFVMSNGLTMSPSRIPYLSPVRITTTESRSFTHPIPTAVFYTCLLDEFLWSEEAKIKYKEAFHLNDVKNKTLDIDEQLEAGCMDIIQSL